MRGVACVAPQAQERRRLLQEVVGDGAVRLVAIGAVLSYRRMFPHKRPLLLRVAFEAQLIECLGLQAFVIFAMGVVTVRTADLAFPDRMMGRQGGQREYLGMAFETGIRFGNSHGPATRSVQRRVRNGNDLWHLRVGMSLVAVRTSHALAIVVRRMPGHGGCAGVTTEAEIRSRLGRDLPVWLMAGGAGELVRAEQLMRPGNFLQLARLRVAAVTHLRLLHRHRPAHCGVRIVAVRAADPGQVVGRSVPLTHVRAFMTRQAKLLARASDDVAVRIVTRGAVEPLPRPLPVWNRKEAP